MQNANATKIVLCIRNYTHTYQKKEVFTMANRFPKDCWDKKCPHFHTKDLSIDDLVCTCDLLKIICDACDEDFCLYLCPLPNEGD